MTIITYPNVVGGVIAVEAMPSVLRVLRMAYNLSQDQLARTLGMHVSYVSHVEREVRRPNPRALRAWIAACPVPVLVSETLLADLSEVSLTARERDVTNGQPDADWILSHLVASSVKNESALWTRRGSEALRFPFPESVSATDESLTVVLWLSVRSLQQYPENMNQLMAIRQGFKEFELGDWREPNIPLLHQRCITPLWQLVETLPVVSEITTPPLGDGIWDELQELWPHLPDTARRGLVAAAREWMKS